MPAEPLSLQEGQSQWNANKSSRDIMAMNSRSGKNFVELFLQGFCIEWLYDVIAHARL
jgi:hypothetical protein